MSLSKPVYSQRFAGYVLCIRTDDQEGQFPERFLSTTSDAVKQVLTDYCAVRNYTIAWRREEQSSGGWFWITTKTPIAMLYWLIEQQPTDELRKQFIGRWSIGMSTETSAMNVIVDVVQEGAKVVMKKFTTFDSDCAQTLADQRASSVPGQPLVPAEMIPSLRTSCFKGLLDEARDTMRQLPAFPGMVCNHYEDTFHADRSLSLPKRADVLRRFVQWLVRYHRDKLSDSYSGSGSSNLEDEYKLIQLHVEGYAAPAAIDPPKHLVVSVLADGDGTPVPYPTRQGNTVATAIGQFLQENPGATLLPPGDERWELVLYGCRPSFKGAINLEFHGAHLQFVPVPGSTTEWCAVQITAAGGMRSVFLLVIPSGATTYTSPVDGSELQLPLGMREPEIPVWKWNPGVVGHTSNLSGFRNLPSNTVWNPYPPLISDQIEKAFQQGETSVQVFIGCSELRIVLGGGNLSSNDLGVQHNGDRKHYVKRMTTTATEMKQLTDARIMDLKAKQAFSTGDTDCAICLTPLTNTDTLLTVCGHIFHPLCVLTCVSATHSATCPLCRGSLCAASPNLLMEQVHYNHGR